MKEFIYFFFCTWTFIIIITTSTFGEILYVVQGNVLISQSGRHLLLFAHTHTHSSGMKNKMSAIRKGLRDELIVKCTNVCKMQCVCLIVFKFMQNTCMHVTHKEAHIIYWLLAACRILCAYLRMLQTHKKTKRPESVHNKRITRILNAMKNSPRLSQYVHIFVGTVLLRYHDLHVLIKIYRPCAESAFFVFDYYYF
jgi:hypothetical protein